MYGYEELKERLEDLGFETDDNEREKLERALERAAQTIINTLNTEDVPNELRFAALDMAAGEYLSEKQEYGAPGISSVSEGDVSLSFDEKEPLECLTDRLLHAGREEMLSYRRIKW